MRAVGYTQVVVGRVEGDTLVVEEDRLAVAVCRVVGVALGSLLSGWLARSEIKKLFSQVKLKEISNNLCIMSNFNSLNLYI